MMHSSLTGELVLDIERLSQTLMAIAAVLGRVPTQENAEQNMPQSTNQSTTETRPQQPLQADQNPLQKTALLPVSAPTQEASVDHSGGESSTSSNPVVTIEQVRAVLAEKSQAELTGEVRKLLGSYGADKLSAVSPDRYAELIEAAKNLG